LIKAMSEPWRVVVCSCFLAPVPATDAWPAAWHSKRLMTDLAPRRFATAPVGQVTRADRRGRTVAAGGTGGQALK
jgi:hypothetical protein